MYGIRTDICNKCTRYSHLGVPGSRHVTTIGAATASIVFSFCLIPSAAVVNRVQHIGALGQRRSYRNNIIIYRRVDCRRRRRRRERRETCSR